MRGSPGKTSSILFSLSESTEWSICFVKHHIMKINREVKPQRHTFFISALESNECSARSGQFVGDKDYPLSIGQEKR